MDIEELQGRMIEVVQRHKEAARTTIETAAEGGRYLREAKEKLIHGDFMDFVRKSGISPRTAQNWMIVSESGLTVDEMNEFDSINKIVLWRREGRLTEKVLVLQARSALLQDQKEALEEETLRAQVAIRAGLISEGWTPPLHGVEFPEEVPRDDMTLEGMVVSMGWTRPSDS